MSREEIINSITSYLEQSIVGNESENSKIDFKTEWYKLTTDEGIMEFLKDTTAIVNTYGPDGFIIIGFDDKSKNLYNVSFSDSGLLDTEKIIGIINKNVDRLFNLDIYSEKILNYNLSIIHIPPSFDKPHVVKNFKRFKNGVIIRDEQHRVFVRKNSTTQVASKHDFELMYWDRKNVIPQYLLYSAIPKNSLSFFAKQYLPSDYLDRLESGNKTEYVRINFKLHIEHYGSRTVGVKKFKVDLFFKRETINELYDLNESFNTIMILKPGDITTVSVEVKIAYGEPFDVEKRKCNLFNSIKDQLSTSHIIYETVFGEVISSDLKFT